MQSLYLPWQLSYDTLTLGPQHAPPGEHTMQYNNASVIVNVLQYVSVAVSWACHMTRLVDTKSALLFVLLRVGWSCMRHL